MIEHKKQTFVNTLRSGYNKDDYIRFLREMLNNVEIKAPDKEIIPYNTFSAAVEYYAHIGYYTGSDKKRVALFSVCLKDDNKVENARGMQRSFVKSLLQGSKCEGALVAFFTKGDVAKWRLSLVRLDYEFSGGRLSEKLTPAKRYSYLVGDKEPCHTAQERLFPIFANDDENPSLDTLEEAFSVEAVTKDFFDRYREKYLDLKEYLESNPQFVKEAAERGFDSEQFAKKLMGQIVFLYFIQKKGWLGVNAFPAVLTKKEYRKAFYRSGSKPKELMTIAYKPGSDGGYHRDNDAILKLSDDDETFLSTLVKGDPWGTGPKDFMNTIFEGCIKKGQNFFDDYLEPLFYTGLNKNRGENAFYPLFHRRIPFLNGGLFEEMDGYDWQNNDFSIPNELFSNKAVKGRDADGILDVFNRYNFTMAEDEPMEREVAIDPEMLGKVFENLLDVKDRKSKGAFYTPREIVHYMCQESLINYLAGKTGISEDDIRTFVLYGEYFKDKDTEKTIDAVSKSGKRIKVFDKDKEMEIPESILSFKNNVNRLAEIDELLAKVKVVDPAVGSGAFPLGMLNEIVKVRNTITSYMLIDLNGAERLLLHSERNIYRLKRETIRDCIFACDIEPSAVDITKLRLWLSLVIDNQIMNEENETLGYSTKPRELPNLDCNIICGNSLLDEFMGHKLMTENDALKNVSEGYQGTFDDQKFFRIINELIDLQTRLYDEKDHTEKDSLKQQIQDKYDSIVLEQIGSNQELADAYYQAAQQPSRPFILWQLYFPKVFRDNGGFDIVIGNPPYVRVQTLEHSLVDKYKKRFSTAWKRIDISTLFFELGYIISNENGIICYISSNQFITTEYGRLIRKFFLEKKINKRMIDFGSLKVFNNAMTYVSIFLLSKRNNNSFGYYQVNNLPFVTPNNSDFVVIKNDSLSDDVWSLGNTEIESVLHKIKTNSQFVLKDIAKPSYGIVTGKDEILMFDIKDDIDVESEMLLSVIRAQGCSRYGEAYPSKKVIYPYIYNGTETELMPLDQIEKKYPKTYQYIIDNTTELKKRKDSRSVFGDRAGWYGLVRFGQKQIFNQVKIVTPGEVKHNKFCIDYSKSGFTGARVFAITVKSDFVNIMYLLGVLNSKVIEFFLHHTASLKAGGYYSYSTTALEQVPIIINKEHEVLELVESIIKSKDNSYERLNYENRLDKMIAELYGLSETDFDVIQADLCD